jgi:YfiH family protein
MIPLDQVEVVDDFTAIGVQAFTTTRQIGTFSTGSDEPVREVMSRWDAVHSAGWEGWLRGPQADGHLATARDTALAVTIADCVPVFVAHPSGAVAALHSGWRGTAARIVEQGIAAFTHEALRPEDLRVHLGPAICGKCYQVSADVLRQLTGRAASAPGNVDLRALISEHARAMGVRHISASPSCTKCDNDRFFSHRAGDAGRQVAVIFVAP